MQAISYVLGGASSRPGLVGKETRHVLVLSMLIGEVGQRPIVISPCTVQVPLV